MTSPGRILYFDNNSSTQIDEKVLEVMLPFLTNNFANASSTHNFGFTANSAVEKARAQVAELISADQNEIIFTSGSTESINIALKGVAENYTSKGKHIVTVVSEHSSVLDTCKYLETKGYEVTYLSVNSYGLVDLNELKNVIRRDTILVCVMYVNNETGVIQPVKDIADLTHAAGSIFLCDATQAVGKLSIEVDFIGIDLLCISGHKLYAPKGVGALYIRQNFDRVKLQPLFHGGGHEKGLRSGTLNVPSIVALGAACDILRTEMKQDAERIFTLRNKLESDLLKIEGSFVNGDTKQRIYNTTNICFPGNDANVMIGRMQNIAVSNGSACSSAVFKPSHVLKAIGLSDDDAFSTIRFSLGKFNTEDEVKEVVNTISELLQ